jgi:dynein heavy chain
VVVQASSSIPFAFEYQGVPTRLVVTPLTDRCWMTLTGALHMCLGGAPAGPAGTGKTESVKDLAKGIARQCVVYNCSDQLDYKTMGKLFSGVSQCGCWTCLDEFNRINIEVLSVVAQQLLTIRQALLANAPTTVLEGRRIAVVPGNGVFITMNPGYAGRTELPDNLKALFRPVSMMVPDYALIAEIMLYAEGFVSARPLALKMVKMYKLCSEQLSQQDHYDYGMRQVKSVLVMAGGQKRGAPDLEEALALIRAMQEANVPRFLAEDLPLFHAIVSDLYPTVKIFASSEFAGLEKAAGKELVRLGLQPEPAFVGKVVELQQTLRVRFGVMLVGPAGAGKSTALATLRDSLTSLRAGGSKDEAHQAVHTTVFNPKCVSMGELYGEFNDLTQEWKDGLASSFIRQAVVDTQDSPDLRWTVFDGPVDALWIENMNTVLDDNSTLCLERESTIPFAHQTNGP